MGFGGGCVVCTVVLSACVTLTVLVSHVSVTDVFGCSLVLTLCMILSVMFQVPV